MDRCVGVFDSGVGGLAVLAHLHRIAPGLATIYVADRRHLPYGEKSEAFVARRAQALTKNLIDQGSTVIAMACNTASSAALESLRKGYAEIRFVGMEPAIKPAVLESAAGVIGVLATHGTLGGRLMARLEEAFGADVRIVRQIGHGLASAVEFGAENESHTITSLKGHVDALQAEGADTLVLGCSHYSFLHDSIVELASGDLTIIDPSEAVAHQIARMAVEAGIEHENPAGSRRYLTTADPNAVATRIAALTGVETAVELVDW